MSLACKERRDAMTKEIARMRQALKKTERYIDVKPAHGEESSIEPYHLDMMAQIVRIYLTIDEFRATPERLPRLLNMTTAQFKEKLRQLEAWGLIRERNGTIEMLKRDLHLPRSSRVFPAFYTQRLLKSIEIVNRGPRADDYNFSVLISSSRETKAKLHARFLEFITAAQKEVGSGPEEEVYLMNFDLVSIP